MTPDIITTELEIKRQLVVLLHQLRELTGKPIEVVQIGYTKNEAEGFNYFSSCVIAPGQICGTGSTVMEATINMRQLPQLPTYDGAMVPEAAEERE